MLTHYHEAMIGETAEAGRVAFFGGSFDPPHLGHLTIARAARAALRLDCVLFAPVGAQPLKPQGSTAPFADRLAMTTLAIEGEPGFQMSLADAPNATGQPNYTLDTLRNLRAALAPGGVLFCLMGADSFAGLRNWRGGAQIPFAAALIVASRPGQRLDDLKAFLPEGVTLERELMYTEAGLTEPVSYVKRRSYLLRNAAGETAHFHLLPGLEVEISASRIREQVRGDSDAQPAGQELLTSSVAAYIRAHGLYR